MTTTCERCGGQRESATCFYCRYQAWLRFCLRAPLEDIRRIAAHPEEWSPEMEYEDVLPIVIDVTIPDGEIWVMKDGQRVGRVINLEKR